MAEDYYKTLGVARGADEGAIKQAYLKLAREYHPDKNPDDPAAKAKFQEIQKAYEVLSDADKRKKYDRFGADFENVGDAGPGGGGFRWSNSGGGPGGAEFDFSDLFGGGGGPSPGGAGGFSSFFDQMRRSQGGRTRAPETPTAEHEITVPFSTAVTGGEVELALQRENQVERIAVKIPAGIESGKKIRLRGQGHIAPGGRRGDLYVKVNVSEHPHFRRRGRDLEVTVPVTLAEAAIGATIDVPAPGGVISVRVPAGSSGGSRLRVKGQGVKTPAGQGDLYVVLQLTLPKNLDDEDRTALENICQKHPANPRDLLRW